MFFKKVKIKYKISIVILTIIGIAVGVIVISNIYDHAFRPGYPKIEQNDMFCTSTWIVQYDSPMDSGTIATSLRHEISTLGEDYDISDRRIAVTQYDTNSIKISVAGSWIPNPTQNNGPNLTKSIEKIVDVKKIEDAFVACR